MSDMDGSDGAVALSIPLESVCFIVIKAREFDAKDVQTVPDSGSNPADDAMRSVLEDRADDPVFEELTAHIDGLNADERVDLVALAWLGRNGGNAEEWPELRAAAAAADNANAAAYLLGLPLLPSHLEAGLAALGMSCDGMERDHL